MNEWIPCTERLQRTLFKTPGHDQRIIDDHFVYVPIIISINAELLLFVRVVPRFSIGTILAT